MNYISNYFNHNIELRIRFLVIILQSNQYFKLFNLIILKVVFEIKEVIVNVNFYVKVCLNTGGFELSWLGNKNKDGDDGSAINVLLPVQLNYK